MMLESTLVNDSCFKCAIEIQFVLYCIVFGFAGISVMFMFCRVTIVVKSRACG